jgi:hypothetical protein
VRVSLLEEIGYDFTTLDTQIAVFVNQEWLKPLDDNKDLVHV